MTYEEIICKMKEYKKGTFLRIVFKTNVPVSAKYKGVTIEKITSCICRTGVRYSQIKENLNNVNPQKRILKVFWEWDEKYKNIIKQNLFSEQKYLTIATIKNGDNIPYVEYRINGEKTTQDKIKGYVIPSYWNRNPIICDIKIENVLKIN